MGIRSQNYLALPPEHPLPGNAPWVAQLGAELRRDARGTLVLFDTNFQPLWARFAGRGAYLTDLDTERALLQFLGTVPDARFRLVRVGELTELAGTWNAAPFHADADVQALEAALRAELGPDYSVLPETEHERAITMFGQPTEALRASIERYDGAAPAFVRGGLATVVHTLQVLGSEPAGAALEALRQHLNAIKFALSTYLSRLPAPGDDSPAWSCLPMAQARSLYQEAFYLVPMSCLSDAQEWLAQAITHPGGTAQAVLTARRCCATANDLVTAWLDPSTAILTSVDSQRD